MGVGEEVGGAVGGVERGTVGGAVGGAVGGVVGGTIVGTTGGGISSTWAQTAGTDPAALGGWSSRTAEPPSAKTRA